MCTSTYKEKIRFAAFPFEMTYYRQDAFDFESGFRLMKFG